MIYVYFVVKYFDIVNEFPVDQVLGHMLCCQSTSHEVYVYEAYIKINQSRGQS